MTDDLLEQLAAGDPVPEDLPALPLHEVLSRIDRAPTPERVRERWREPKRRSIALFALAGLSAAIVVAVVIVILSANHHRTESTTAPGATQGVVNLDVFERAQTPKDRTLFSVTRQVARRDHLAVNFANVWLGGVIPSQTRYVRTISDGREVFLAALINGMARGLVHNPNTRPARRPDGEVALKLLIVQPDGKPAAAGTGGQPIEGGGLGEVNNRIAGIEARSGGGCAGTTIWSIMPNGITRVRWQFPRQDRYGNTYPTPLSVTVPASDNIAVATIHGRANCDQPTVTTLYNATGHVVHRYGNPATLRRTVTPSQVRHAILQKTSRPRPTAATCRPSTASARARASLRGAQSVFFSCTVTLDGQTARYYVQVLANGSFIAQREIHGTAKAIYGCCVTRRSP